MKEKQIEGWFKYDKDSRRFHRFLIEGDDGLVGSVYVPKTQDVPEKILLTYIERVSK